MKQIVYDPPEVKLLGGLYSSGGSKYYAESGRKEIMVWIE